MAALDRRPTGPDASPGRRGRSRWRCLWLSAAAATAVLAGCSSGDGSQPTEPAATSDTAEASQPEADGSAQTAQPEPSTGDPATAVPTTDGPTTAGPDGAGGGQPTCRQIEVTTAGDVERLELIETSGLVAGRADRGVLWAINDSGQEAGIYAIDETGRDLGFFALTGPDGPIATVDTEDLAMAGGQIHLADIGDNGRRRPSVQIYLLDEPSVGGGPAPDGTVNPSSIITATYPDGPTDAEALLADPVTGELLILSKDGDDGDAPTRLYAVPPQVDGGRESVETELVGMLDVAALTARSSRFSIAGLIFPGAVTGADISEDGRTIALRTYGSVWLFPRLDGQTMAEALTGNEPCEGGTDSEPQGETVAFLPTGQDGSLRYATISEGNNPPVNVVAVELANP
ncbi:MAG: hypothetical protein ACR2QK_09070 [Acidimicrobiales bacterium]